MPEFVGEKFTIYQNELSDKDVNVKKNVQIRHENTCQSGDFGKVGTFVYKF